MKNAYITRRIAPQGYVAVTKPLAKDLYEKNIDVTLAGNNINAYHIFGGWHLGYTVNKKEVEEKTTADHSFQDICNNFLMYLEDELGTYPVFYVKKEDVSL